MRRMMLAALAVLALCGWAAAARGEIKLGALVPATGKGAAYGQEQKLAIQIAVEEINAGGGVKGNPLDVIVFDTQGDNAQAIAGARKLIAGEGVLAVLGPYFTEEVEVAFPLAVEMRTVMISASSAKPGVAARFRPWGFRNAMLLPVAYPVGARQWASRYGIKTAAVIHDGKDAFARAGAAIFARALEGLGVKVVDTVTFQTGDTSFAAQVTRVKAANPDGVVLEGVELELANIVREMRRQGLRAHVLGGLGLAGPRVIETAGAANIEGSYSVTGYLWDGADPKTRSFVTKFRERSRKIPHFTTAQMYDTVYLVKAALEAAALANRPEALALDREKVRRAIEGIRDFPGVTGRTSINAEGDVDKQVFVIVAHDGGWVPAP